MHFLGSGLEVCDIHELEQNDKRLNEALLAVIGVLRINGTLGDAFSEMLENDDIH